MNRQQAPKVGGPSPWGRVQSVREVLPGVRTFSTASHGGAWVAPELRDQISPEGRAHGEKWAKGWGPGWFEEDCSCAFVVLAFNAYWPKEAKIAALQMIEALRRWNK